ncbi:uncharacterized protein TNCV_4488521, partial [Trichonephila clavipes]
MKLCLVHMCLNGISGFQGKGNVEDELAGSEPKDLSVKINDTLCAPRHMPVRTDTRELMKNISWIENEEMLDMIMTGSDFSTFSEDDLILETGHPHEDVKVITSGVLQISGVNDGKKYNMLPNTDSLWYFVKTGSFCEYLNAPE